MVAKILIEDVCKLSLQPCHRLDFDFYSLENTCSNSSHVRRRRRILSGVVAGDVWRFDGLMRVRARAPDQYESNSRPPPPHARPCGGGAATPHHCQTCDRNVKLSSRRSGWYKAPIELINDFKSPHAHLHLLHTHTHIHTH